MKYISFYTPPYPFFQYSGDALFRSGDIHGARNSLPHFDIIFVEYGELYLKEREDSYHLKKNDMLILSPHQKHYGYKRCHCETYFHWLHFNTTEDYKFLDMAKSYLDDATVYSKVENAEQIIIPVFQSLKQEQAIKVIQIMERLETISINKKLSSFLINQSNSNSKVMEQKHFFELLSLIAIHERKEQGSSKKIAAIVTKYLETNYADAEISLEKLAKIANCHPIHLIRCFNHEYGLTPFKVLIGFRIQNAKEFLLTTDLPIERIAELVGFSSGSYFSKVFKKHTGVTPKGFRQNER